MSQNEYVCLCACVEFLKYKSNADLMVGQSNQENSNGGAGAMISHTE